MQNTTRKYPQSRRRVFEAVEVFPNVIDRANRYDVLIRIRMIPEALAVYDDSEIHKTWKRDYGKYLEKKAIFDYEG